MPDKLKAKVFTIFILKVTHNEALFWCFRFTTNHLQFSINEQKCKKSFPITSVSTRNSDAIVNVLEIIDFKNAGITERGCIALSNER